LVTEVDKAVEDFITRKIKAAYPEHKLCVWYIACDKVELTDSIGEETYSGEKITDEPTWIGRFPTTLRGRDLTQ
jgi:myo-inositol-1(or 4)-monophosphatase